jgi:hypothetical protein
LNDHNISYKLARSHSGPGDKKVEIQIDDDRVTGFFYHKRYKIPDEWTKSEMIRSDNILSAQLPHQLPAGKLEYFIVLESNDQKIIIPDKRTVIIRFTGFVPPALLILHVICMFTAMLLSTATGLEAIMSGRQILLYTLLTNLFLFIGGMILGPVVQKFAFGAFWTGIPFGWDLTDNKTLMAVIGWLIALSFAWRKPEKKSTRWLIITATFILMLVYSIPHSTLGSELDYKKMEIVTGN